jgi:hypothetical protein
LSLNSISCQPSGRPGGRWKSQAPKKQTSERGADAISGAEAVAPSRQAGRDVTRSKTRMNPSIPASTAAGTSCCTVATEKRAGTVDIPAARRAANRRSSDGCRPVAVTSLAGTR